MDEIGTEAAMDVLMGYVPDGQKSPAKRISRLVIRERSGTYLCESQKAFGWVRNFITRDGEHQRVKGAYFVESIMTLVHLYLDKDWLFRSDYGFHIGPSKFDGQGRESITIRFWLQKSSSQSFRETMRCEAIAWIENSKKPRSDIEPVPSWSDLESLTFRRANNRHV